MTRDHYKPVPLDLDATHARWSKRPGYLEAYEALADEFAALNELLRARKAAGMTQADVAERMGIAQASVARLEASAGSRKLAPSVATLRRYLLRVGNSQRGGSGAALQESQRPLSLDQLGYARTRPRNLSVFADRLQALSLVCRQRRRLLSSA